MALRRGAQQGVSKALLLSSALQGTEVSAANQVSRASLRCISSSVAPSAADYSYEPPGTSHCFVPGPVNIHEKTRRAMMVPGQNHRDPWFSPFFSKLLEDVRLIFGTSNAQTFIYPATGTGGWESGLQNTLSPGDKVLTWRYGQFSHLWVDMMERLGLEVQVIDADWGAGVDEVKLAEILKADTEKKIKAVAVVHNETTTGVTSDVGKIRETMDGESHPALLLVDGVSSIGGLNFEFDKWKVDVAITGSQKALSLPTGLCVLAVSDKALEAHKTAKMPRVYFAWQDMLNNYPGGQVPYTPIIPLLHGLRASLDLLSSEGFDNVVKRHHRLAEGTRKAAEAWGLKLLCKDPRWRSDSLTVIEVPEGVDSSLIVKNAFARYNLSLGVGLSKVAGKVFRIGHLGNNDEIMIASAICGAEMSMLDAGMKIQPGSGIGAALKYWQETSSIIPTRAAP
ncbi:hypothetical protein WJX74_003974 [Apatococcus lobatus]|uniref:Aminotransferase class V domain-containing protein n=1 Tax=Apatococcus lobatus TaxID=904363 RepID=A0AAW1S9V6_9CHLO